MIDIWPEFALVFLDLPEWEQKPANTESKTGETVMLYCKAKYADKYEWFVNGVPLKEST